MRNRLRWFTFFVAFFILSAVGSFFAFSNEAYACSCVEPGTIQDRKEQNDAVFEGKVVSIKQTSSLLFNSPGKIKKATFEVNQVWKGHVTSRIEVITALHEDSCGFNFKEGERYIVYASSSGSALETGLCSGITLQSEASEHVTALGSGSIPRNLTVDPDQTFGMSFNLIITIICSVCLLGIVFIVYRRNKKTKSKT